MHLENVLPLRGFYERWRFPPERAETGRILHHFWVVRRPDFALFLEVALLASKCKWSAFRKRCSKRCSKRSLKRETASKTWPIPLSNNTTYAGFFPGLGGPDWGLWPDVRRGVRPKTSSWGWFFVSENLPRNPNFQSFIYVPFPGRSLRNLALGPQAPVSTNGPVTNRCEGYRHMWQPQLNDHMNPPDHVQTQRRTLPVRNATSTKRNQ